MVTLPLKDPQMHNDILSKASYCACKDGPSRDVSLPALEHLKPLGQVSTHI